MKLSKNKELNALVLGFIAYFTFYYNRKCVTLIFPHLIKEGLTQENAGWFSLKLFGGKFE